MKALKFWRVLVAGLLSLSLSLRVDAQTVARLLVLPVQVRLEVGATGQISVDVQDASSQSISRDAVPVTFISADTTVAVVSTEGTVQALRAGRTQITVRAGTRTQVIAVTISAPRRAPEPPAPAPAQTPVQPTPAPTSPSSSLPRTLGPAASAVTIYPTRIELLQGERLRPTLRLIMPDGTQVEAARDVTWTVLGQAVTYDAATNEVIGVVPGGGTLSATYAGRLKTAQPVTVGEAAIVTDRDSLVMTAGNSDSVAVLVPTQGRRRVTQNLAWRSTEPTVVKVLNPAEGVFQAGAPGTATLILEAYGLTRTVQVRVMPRLARIETSVPAGSSFTVGAAATARLQAKPIATDGTALPNELMTWRIADTTIARIDTTGTVTGVREGTTLLTIDAAGVERLSWPVSVLPTRATFAEAAQSVQVGASLPLAVSLRGVGRKDYGAVPSPRFRSLSPDIAGVDARGVVSGVGLGRAEIVVAQDGAGADTTTVFVTGRTLLAGTMGGVSGIWQLTTDSDTAPALIARGDSGTFSQAVWSPDRTRIAATFEPRDRPNQARIVVFDADGRNGTAISPDSLNTSDPAWTTTGTAVLAAGVTAKTYSVLRIGVPDRTVTPLIVTTTSRLRYPIPDADTSAILVRLEANNQVDVARVRGGTSSMLSLGKPREEFIARLSGGRLLVAVDSAARGRTFALFTAVPGADQLQSPTAVRLPAGLAVIDIARGNDDTSVIVVGRSKSWPGVGAATVVLKLPLDGSEPKVLLTLGEKDTVTARTQ